MNNKQEFRSLNSLDLEVQELEHRLELSAACAATWLDSFACVGELLHPEVPEEKLQ